MDAVRGALARVQAGESVIQEFGDAQEYLIRIPVGGHTLEELSKRIDGGLREAGLPAFEVRRLEFVGPQVGRDLQWDALQAVLWGMVGILVYTAMRFDFKGGVAAIIALLHDVVISVGAMSMAHREMSLPVLAALLTIVGFSINDTIVTFDRIRENRGRGLRRGETLADVINAAINQTLSRTILTSLTVFLVVAVLFIFGGRGAAGLRVRAPGRGGDGHLLDDLRGRADHPGLGELEPGAPAGGQEGRGEGRRGAVNY